MSENVHKMVYDALDASGYPVSAQGSYAPDDPLPDTFLMYQFIYDEALLHAFNDGIGGVYRVQVALYSTDPAITQGGWGLLNSLMTGFRRIGGVDLPLDKETGHYGYTCDYYYYDYEEE